MKPPWHLSQADYEHRCKVGRAVRDGVRFGEVKDGDDVPAKALPIAKMAEYAAADAARTHRAMLKAAAAPTLAERTGTAFSHGTASDGPFFPTRR